MGPPPVQYVTTRDGFNIAYTVAGSGHPFVFMPWPFSNVSLIWETSFGRPLLDALAERFMLVQYDSRGQGMSTRGLPEDHSLDDYLLDLEAVTDRLGLDRFVLYGAPLFSNVAVRFAAKHPERVGALILGEVVVDQGHGPWGFQEELIRRDWEGFLHIITSSFSIQGAPIELPYWRQSVTQDDCLAMVRATRGTTIRDILPSIEVPTLIINTRRLTADTPVHRLAFEGQEAASLIPNTRLILYDGFASFWYSPEPPPAVLAIADFVSGLVPRTGKSEALGGKGEAPPHALSAQLSAREIEVLRLVTQGKTNREIGAELVISERTVINHLSHIFIKTGAENRAGATAYALRHGLA